jgi:Stress responsive A/B Barrel Domain
LHVHVVMVTLKDPAEADRCAEAMASMAGRIPGLVALDVRRNELAGPHACHLALTTTWDDVDAYVAYTTDPVHLEVAAVVRSLMDSATTVDYTLEDVDGRVAS